MIQRDTCTPMFTAALFTTAKTQKQPKCPSTEEWIKMWYLYTAVKKKIMDEPRDYQNKSEKDKGHMMIAYMHNQVFEK